MKRKIIVAISVVLLLSVLSICLFACNSSNNTMDYVEKLYKKGYSVYVGMSTTLNENEELAIVCWGIRAVNPEKWANLKADDPWGGIVEISIYTDKNEAKQEYDRLKAAWDGIDVVSVVLKGNAVIYGDTECVKDAK